MKKKFLLGLSLMLLSILSINAQVYTENFDVDGNWAGGSMTGYNAKSYTNTAAPGGCSFSTNAAVRETSNVMSGYAWRVDDLANAYLRLECDLEVQGFSVQMARWDNSPVPNVTVRYSTDAGSTYTDIESFDGNIFTADKTYQLYSYTFSTAINPDAGSKIYIEFLTTAGERMIYDDFTLYYTASGATNPVISGVTHYPAAPTSADAVSVFANITDDGTVASAEVQWGTTMGTYTQTIAMSDLGGGVYTSTASIPAMANGTTVYYVVFAEDDETYSTTSTEGSYTVTDPVGVVDVATVAELRAQTADNTTEYRLTGEAFITYMNSYRNRKYIQDATAGIVIDDDPAVISSTYNRYDGLTNVTGTLEEYNGLLQFHPTADPGAATSNVVQTALVATPDAINTAVDMYESELVVLNNVSFVETGTFANGTNYTLTDGTNNIVFRTNFYNVDYIGTAIPVGQVNVTALVVDYTGTAQVTARELTDIEAVAGTNPVISGVTHYPAAPTSTDAVSVFANITDDGTVASAEVQWGTTMGTYTQTIAMSDLGGGVYTSTVSIPAMANGTTVYYVVFAEDDETYSTTSTEASYTVTDPVGVVDVATVAELRAQTADNTTEYRLTGEAFITYMNSYRNRKYIQDATAGIVIDDDPAVISSTYNRYDGLTNVTGTLEEYNGLLQFHPTADPGAATSNVVQTALVATPDAINTAVDMYESELVVLNNVSFVETGTFANGTNYTLTDGINNIVFRTNFFNVDYIGTDIPVGQVNVTALVVDYNGTAQVTARELTDIEVLITDEPLISNVVYSPMAPNSSDAVTVSADITDNGTIATAELNWGTTMGTYTQTIAMTNSSGDTYTSDIPAMSSGTTVYFQIFAEDDETYTATTMEYSYTVFDLPTETLFFSEYIEGSSQNKALEIYNPTSTTVDLTNYRVAYANNGNDWSEWHTFTVTTSLDAGDVIVIAAEGCDAAIAAVADEILTYPDVVFFNGDDALALEMTTDGGATWNIVDIIGDPNNDPGSGWAVAGTDNATSNHTLVRKYPDVMTGNNDWTSSAGTNVDDSEWLVFEADDFTYIGWHGELPTDPTLVIVTPVDGSTVYTSTVAVDLNVQNFTVAAPSNGDGYILADLNGMTFDVYTTTFDFTNVPVGTYTLTATLVDNGGNVLDPNVSSTVTFYVDETTMVSIYDIQYTTDAGDGTYPSTYDGMTVQTQGIVTAVDPDGQYFIQDGDGGWNGVYVYDFDNTVNLGDEVVLTATVTEYNGLTELTSVADLQVLSSGNTLPTEQTISTLEANDEQFEGVLIKVMAECTNADAGFGMWTVNDGSGDLLVDDDLFAYTATATYNYEVTGVGHYSYGAFKILPRDINDIVEIWGLTENATQVTVYPNPAVNFVNITGDVQNVELFSTLGQSIDVQRTLNTVDVSGLNSGIYLMRITLTNGDVVTKQIIKN